MKLQGTVSDKDSQPMTHGNESLASLKDIPDGDHSRIASHDHLAWLNLCWSVSKLNLNDKTDKKIDENVD